MLVSNFPRDARAVSGDDRQILRQPIVEITRHAPALGQRSAPRQPSADAALEADRRRQDQRAGEDAQPLVGADPLRGERPRHKLGQARAGQQEGRGGQQRHRAIGFLATPSRKRASRVSRRQRGPEDDDEQQWARHRVRQVRCPPARPANREEAAQSRDRQSRKGRAAPVIAAGWADRTIRRSRGVSAAAARSPPTTN